MLPPRADERAGRFANGIAFHGFLFRSRVFRRSHYCPTCIEQEAEENREYGERKGKKKRKDRETVTNVKRDEGKRVEFAIRDMPR